MPAKVSQRCPLGSRGGLARSESGKKRFMTVNGGHWEIALRSLIDGRTHEASIDLSVAARSRAASWFVKWWVR